MRLIALPNVPAAGVQPVIRKVLVLGLQTILFEREISCLALLIVTKRVE